MIVYFVAMVLIGTLLSWLWRTNGDPLVYLVPPALAFSPLLRYAGETLGSAGAWLSVRKALVLALAISLAFRFLKGDYQWRRIPGMAVVAPYLCLVVLSVVWSVAGPSNSDAAEILDEFVDWAVPVAVFFCLAASPSSERRIASAGRVMAVTVLAVAVYCGLQALVLLGQDAAVPRSVIDLTEQGREDFWWGSSRVYGPFASTGPNALGVFLLLPAAYAATRVLDARGSARVGWAAIVLLAAAVIAGTLSRAAQLGLIVVLIALPIVRRTPRAVMAVSVFLLFAAGLLAETTVGQHFRSLYGAGGSIDPDIGYRVSVWRVLLSGVADHPLGFGFDGWRRASQHVVIAGLSALPGSPQSGAGQWMRELGDRGFAGVCLLALMMVGLFIITLRGGARHRPQGVQENFLTAAAAGVAAFAVTFAGDDYLMLDVVAGMFWYVAGLALAAVRDDHSSPGAQPDPWGSSSGSGALRTVDPTLGHPHIVPL